VQQRLSSAKGILAVAKPKEEEEVQLAAADSSEAQAEVKKESKKKKLDMWAYTGDEHMRVYKKDMSAAEQKAENEAARQRTLFERKRVRDRVST